MHKIRKIFQFAFGLLLFAAFTPGHAISVDDLLTPQQAFQISADGSSRNEIRVKWRIADGYYLYQSKIKFSTDSPNITLTEPDFPEAEIREDEFFGKISTYRNEVLIDIPILTDSNTPDIITLYAKSQGCADIGVCFPPQTQTVLVALSSTADQPAAIDPNDVVDPTVSGSGPAESIATIDDVVDEDPLAALTAFNDEIGFAEEDDILPPEKAYLLFHRIEEGDKLVLSWQIAEGTYLYNDKIKLTLEGDEGLTIGSYDLPKPKLKKDGVRADGTIGEVKIYKDSLSLTAPLINNAAMAGNTTLTVKYQGCAERGICYPPVKKTFSISFPKAGEGPVFFTDVPVADSGAAKPSSISSANEAATEEDKIANLIKSSGTFAIIGIFFLIGLGLAFTPCVFPMIPILSGIITGQGESITTAKATYLSTVYVLAMAITYTVAGVFAAMSGENLQILLQIPWVIAVFAGIFVLLALSMFGFYELQLPSSLQSKLTEMSNRQSGGTTIGVAIMGLLSALIVGPCVAPPLAGALLYISQTNDPVIGGLALFAMSMGMGLPLILIGASAGKLLPRAGAWMDTVKAVFGVSLLGLAIYFLERILPETIILILWGTLLISSAIYMGALQQLPIEASGWKKLWKGLGVVLMIYGTLMLIGAAANSTDVRQPLRGLAFSGSSSGHAEDNIRHFKRITTMAELDQQLANAKANGKPALLDFYADWCVYCKTLEKEIFPAPQSQAAFADAVLIQADVTDANSDEARALMKRFNVIAPPVIVFWDRQGNELKQHKIVGDVSLEDFVATAKRAIQ